jgi:uncharacterized membrane protein
VDILTVLFVIGTAFAAAILLPILSFVRASRAERTAFALAIEVAALRRAVESLRTEALAASPDDTAATAPAADGDAEWRETVRRLQTSPTPEDAQEAARADAGEDPGAIAGEIAGADLSAVAPSAKAEAPALQAPASEPVDAQHAEAESLEQRIGGRWLLYAGIAALILGISYFIKFAFDNGWVSEPLRVVVGLAAGVALITGGLRFSRQGLGLFGQVLTGGGVVVLYLALFAALHIYDLISPGVAFVAMVAVTAAAAWLADRERSQPLALLAIIGGFATPALVGGHRDAQVVLFTYVAILLAGTTVLAHRHTWPWLHLVSYGLTALTVLVWHDAHYRPDRWLRTVSFLTLFVVLFGAVTAALRRRAATSFPARVVTLVLYSAPFLYHVATITMLAPHPGPLLVYLVLASVAGLSISHHTNAPWLRSIVLLVVALPLIGWSAGLVRPGWYPATIVTMCAVYGLHLAGQWRAMSEDEEPADVSADVPVAEAVHAHLTGLFLPVALYMFFETRFAWWNPPMLSALAVWNAAIAAVTWTRVPMLAWQYAAIAATLTAVAIGVWFDGPAVAVGWAMEAAALAWFAVGRANRWLGAGSAALFVLAAVRLLDMLAQPLAINSWAVFNTRTLAVALVVGAAAWVARLLRTAPLAEASTARHVLVIGAHVLAIVWMSVEILAVFRQQAWLASADGRPVGVARSQLVAQVALSVAWALYGVGLVAVGFVRQYAPARYLAIALFGLTIFKVFTQDIAQLDRVYQMLSVLGVGALLVFASYLYQRRQRG